MHKTRDRRVCRNVDFCSHRFGEWTGLKNHITKGHCHLIPQEDTPPDHGETTTAPAAPAEADPQESAATTGEDLPPAQHPGALKIVREQGWTSLITSGSAEKLE